MEGEAMEGRLRVGGKDGWDMRGNEEDGGGERKGRMERREGKKGKGRIDSSREGGRGGQEEERVVNKRDGWC